MDPARNVRDPARNVRDLLKAESYLLLQQFLLDLQERKDLRPCEVAHLLLDAAKAWTKETQ